MSGEERLLARALEDYWDWRWEKLPSREELEEMHRFSPELLRELERLWAGEKAPKVWRRSYGVRAAGMALALTACLGAVKIFQESGKHLPDVQEKTAEGSSEAGGIDGGEASGEMGGSGKPGETAGEADDGEERSWRLLELEGLRGTAVLENAGEKSVGCSPVLKAEQKQDGVWKEIWSRREPWKEERLGAGEYRKEEMRLEEFGISREGEYRLIRRLGEEEISLVLSVAQEE